MTAAPQLRIGSRSLDPDRGVLRCADGTGVSLRPKTLELLLLLHRHGGRVVARGEILDALWPDLHVTDDSITQCVVELRRALGPDAALLRTVAKRGYLLEAEAPVTVPPAVPAAVRSMPVVALLPFRLLPDAPDLALVAEGILDGIVGALAGLREPVVISANSTRHLAAEADLPSVGQRLGAHYVTAGTLRRAGDRLRLGMELAEAQSGRVLWQRSFDLVDAALFETQDRIAAIIAHTLAPRVQEAELRAARQAPPRVLGAYHLLLQARQMVFRLERQAFETAGGMLRQAIALDPGFAPGYAALGDWHSLRIGQGWSPDAAAETEALEAAVRTALDLDPGNARALALLGHSHTVLRRRYADAVTQFDRALEAAPNDAEAWLRSSPTYAFMGEGQEALRRADQALALSPEDPLIFRYQHYKAIAHYAADELEAAAEWGLRSQRANPHYTSNLRLTAASLAALGRLAEARPLVEQVMALEPDSRASLVAARTPYRDPATRELYRRRVAAAGLPA
ncbi:winged helix-turn-helix domain-containing protein [Falsiroseomonas sp. E2-1-a20]|uniref:winged helix-turn-helix domain-containing protein n=1 Tax=Falsiroseomonas sp. E2-1-a20 TaxID=3239300 RepID=UPI003F382F68